MLSLIRPIKFGVTAGSAIGPETSLASGKITIFGASLYSPSNDATALIYDDSAATGGKEAVALCTAAKGSSHFGFGGGDLAIPLQKGGYIVVTGTGAFCIVYVG